MKIASGHTPNCGCLHIHKKEMTVGELYDIFLDQEPYVMEHVWDRIEVEQMNVVIR